MCVSVCVCEYVCVSVYVHVCIIHDDIYIYIFIWVCVCGKLYIPRVRSSHVHDGLGDDTVVFESRSNRVVSK